LRFAALATKPGEKCGLGQGSPAIGHSLAVVNRAGRSNSKLKTQNSKLKTHNSEGAPATSAVYPLGYLDKFSTYRK
jgi:hypothetical protein